MAPKNFMTAAQAKNLTRTSQKPINNLFRCIKEQAEYGMCNITYDVSMFDSVVVENIVTELKLANYNVERLEEDVYAALKISW